MALDKRINAFRPGLAALSLKGQVEAERFVEGRPLQIAIGRASLRGAPSGDAPQDSELLFGESVTVHDSRDGWAWVQAAQDRYVGYVRETALGNVEAATLRVSALMAPVFPQPDLKTPVQDFLPLNAKVPVRSHQGDYVEIAQGRYLHQRHLAPDPEKDFVAIAERFVGVPYVWGGRSFAGLDCSGLIQTAMQAVGVVIPRDTDMQETFFTLYSEAPQRGDLVFWKGHVGVMLDATRLLHANVFHMAVAVEPLAQAEARIEKIAGLVTSIKRPL